MSAGQMLLLLVGWAGVSVLTAALLVPILVTASRADRRMGPAAPEPPDEPLDPPAAGGRRDAVMSVLRDSGYRGIVLERLVLHACTIFDADQVCVLGRDSRARDEGLVLAQGAGVDPDLIGCRLGSDWDPILVAVACGRPLALPGDLWPAWRGHDVARSAPGNAAVAPIWFGGRLQGAVAVVHARRGEGLGVSGLALLGEVAELAGRALAHTEGRQLSAADPQAEIDGLLGTLARVEAAARDQGDAVAAVARRLADELGLGGPERLELGLALRLHEVGRVRLPGRLARGHAELTDAERELIRLHPLWGAEMVARIPGLEAVALIVRLCHERWDGGGYPDGLAGERIPLASRIIALSEAYASMTAPRPAGRALDAAAAVEELRGQAGSSFDPDLTARVAEAVEAAHTGHPV